MKIICTIFCLLSLVAYAQEKSKYVADSAKTKIEWTGKKLTGEHYGEIKLKSGELIFSNGKLSGGTFELNMNSITCTDISDAKSNKRLVDHLKSDDFFAVNRFPTCRFTITSVKQNSTDEYVVSGDLTIKGKASPVTFPVKLVAQKNELIAQATMTFDRSKYDVKFGSQSFYEGLGDKLVYDDVDIAITLTVIK